jgi:hypothetical protein
LLLTPTADTPEAGSGLASLSIFSGGDNHVVAGTHALSGDTELTVGITGGDQPDAIMVSGKQRVYRSADGRTRAAVGILDLTDEIDTTAYAVVSRDYEVGRRVGTVSAGIGGGDLLDGLFLNAAVPVNERTTGILEWVDIGDEDDLNLGLSWRAKRGLDVKTGVVDGEAAFSVNYELRF